MKRRSLARGCFLSLISGSVQALPFERPAAGKVTKQMTARWSFSGRLSSCRNFFQPRRISGYTRLAGAFLLCKVLTTEYTDNRRQGWTYDADGRPVLEDTLEHKYDASGRKYWSKDTAPHAHFSPGLTISQGFGGDGQRLKQIENNSATYLIRSSVLDEVIWEISHGSGISVKKTGFVYGAGRMLATQTLGLFGNQQIVTWRYQNPVTGSQRGLEPTELDPLGLNAGLAAAEEGPPGGGEAPDLVFPRFGDILNGSSGCMMNGSMVSCGTVMFFMEIFGTIVLPADNPLPPKLVDLPSWKWHPSDSGDSRLGLYAEGGDDEIPPLPAEEVDIIDFYDPITTREPQNSDCLTFANIVEQIANRSSNKDEFMEHMVTRFIGPNLNSQSGADFEKGATIGNREFGSSGFKSQFVDHSNQVRHFTGGLWAGYLYGPGIGQLGMNSNEDSAVSEAGILSSGGGILPSLWPSDDSKADVALNSISVGLGVNLTPRNEQRVDVGDRGGWRKIPANPGYKGLATAIRAQVCE
jgi:hypothetical protein